MKIGDIVNYFGRDAEVIDLNQTHCLIKFIDSGTKLCTQKSTFEKDYK